MHMNIVIMDKSKSSPFDCIQVLCKSYPLSDDDWKCIEQYFENKSNSNLIRVCLDIADMLGDAKETENFKNSFHKVLCKSTIFRAPELYFLMQQDAKLFVMNYDFNTIDNQKKAIQMLSKLTNRSS
jgi:hypothetical protein